MNSLAQQTVTTSIPKYPFKISNMETVTRRFSAQGVTGSGTTKSDMSISITGSNAGATSTGNYIIPDFARTLKLDANALVSPAYYITLDHIDANGGILRFLEPISASVTYQDNTYFCQNEDLGIVSTSAKLEDCIKDFEDEILFVWNEYGREDDSRLTKDAKELKRRILRYISK